MTIKINLEIEIPDRIYQEFLKELEEDELVQLWYFAAEANENIALFARKLGAV